MSRRFRTAVVGAFPFPSPQGSQVFVRAQCVHAARAGHEVHLVTYGQGERFESAGVRHHRVRRLPGDDARRSGPTPIKPALDLLMVAKLRHVVRRHGIEIIHAHNYEAAAVSILTARLTGVPVLYHSHNLMGDELDTYFERPWPKRAAAVLGRWLDRTIPRRADHAIALCEYSAARLRESGVDPARLTVIPPATDDLGAAEGDPDSIGRARERAGLPRAVCDPARPLLGYCGNLDAYQGLETMLDALVVARGAVPDPADAPQLLVATHRREPAFERQVRARGLEGPVHVVEVAEFDEMRAAMHGADVLLLPRRLGSGYPVKLLNYMSAAKPVVVAGCGGKVLTDRVDGRVVADDDPRSMGVAIQETLADREAAVAMGLAARAAFLDKLVWERVWPRIETVYERLGRRSER